MGAIACFWLEETMRARRELRRFTSGVAAERCPVTGYHNAAIPIDEVAWRRAKCGTGEEHFYAEVDGADAVDAFRNDARWPTHCLCGYEFAPNDRWQVFFEYILRRLDSGEEMTLRGAPPGAMWDAWRYGTRWFMPAAPDRPDALHLMVRTPGGDWYVDGPTRQGSFWSRTGDPRNPATLTVTPSILFDTYHGWLRAGQLVPA